MTRLFTDSELEKMGARTLDLLKRAVDDGDKEEAKRLADRMYHESAVMHDIYCEWIAGMAGHIATHYGDDALYETYKAGLTPWVRPMSEKVYGGKDLRTRVELLAVGLRGHLKPIKIVEDDEKFTFMMEPCGSGGQLVLKGRYGPPTNLHRIKKPQPLTLGRPDFPVYCSHSCLLMVLPIERTGKPWFVEVPPEDVADIGKKPCWIFLYKDPDAVPAKYYEMVGKRKPAGLSGKESVDG